MDERVEELLRRSRPEPGGEFVEALERQLFPRRAHSRRPLLAGVAAALGVAFALLGLSLAGVGPLGGTDHGVQAGTSCRYVTVTRHEQTPVIVQHASGQTTLHLQERPVERRIKRCS
jgi:hypothetical protein